MVWVTAQQNLGFPPAFCRTELVDYAVDMADDKGNVSRTCGAGGPAAWQLVDRLCSALLIIVAQRMEGPTLCSTAATVALVSHGGSSNSVSDSPPLRVFSLSSKSSR